MLNNVIEFFLIVLIGRDGDGHIEIVYSFFVFLCTEPKTDYLKF